MRMLNRLFLSLALVLGAMATTSAKPHDYLRACWRQLGQPLKGSYLVLSYRETVNELEHNLAPWQTTAYTGRGTVWVTADRFLKQDTLTAVARQRTYFSSTQRSATSLLYRDYGDQDLFAATQGMQQDYVFRAARYSPLSLLAYFQQHYVVADATAPAGLASYRTTINQTVVQLFIRQQDALLAYVTLLGPDELLGDVTTTFRYLDYAHLGKLVYATRVQVEKTNGNVTDEVQLRPATVQVTAPTLLTAPANYHLLASAELKPEVRVETYRPHLHFVELKHTNDRALVVEFEQFLLVAEAPLSSQNGELLIEAAQKLAPGKPIRYFVAGHHHPHYLGGVRPFVQRGAIVLVGAGNEAYVRYLVTAPHTLHPDSLQRHPRPVQVEEIPLHGRKTITDDWFEMQIYCIGAQSAHTNDYLLYYFPSEKLLFEDDLAGIPQQGPIRKASARQAGLYHAIQELHLNVETVVQSWPVGAVGIKTIFPFSDLEQSTK
jgi:glyoxylase-like metal-dependent hydrolase (beta-lactamase superfamily II)